MNNPVRGAKFASYLSLQNNGLTEALLKYPLSTQVCGKNCFLYCQPHHQQQQRRHKLIVLRYKAEHAHCIRIVGILTRTRFAIFFLHIVIRTCQWKHSFTTKLFSNRQGDAQKARKLRLVKKKNVRRSIYFHRQTRNVAHWRLLEHLALVFSYAESQKMRAHFH